MERASTYGPRCFLAGAVLLLACVVLLAAPAALAWADDGACGYAYLVDGDAASSNGPALRTLVIDVEQWDEGEAGFVSLGPIRDGEAVPWQNRRDEIGAVEVRSSVAPTSMEEWFSGCTALAVLDLSGLDTSQVASMAYLFSDCSSLRSADLSSFNTSQTRDFQGMFSGCSSLRSVDLSWSDTSQAENMSEMFFNCASLTALDLSWFDTSKVTRMDFMFCGCSALASLDVSSFDTSMCERTNDVFYSCDRLQRLAVGPGLVLAENGVEWCDALKDDQEWMPQADGAAACYGWEGIAASVQEFGEPTWFERQFSARYSGECGTCAWEVDDAGTLVIRPNGDEVGYLDGWSWEDGDDPPWYDIASQIVKVEFWGTVYAQTCNGMFDSCWNLQSIDLAGLDTSEVMDMAYMFSACHSLSQLDLSGFDTSDVADMSGMFHDAISLEELNLSSFDTSNVVYMEEMFSGCTELAALDLSGFDTSNVDDMSGMFSACSSLARLDLLGFDSGQVDVRNMFGIVVDGEPINGLLALTEFRVGEAWEFSSGMNFPTGVWRLPDGQMFNTENLPSGAGDYQRISWDETKCAFAVLSNDGALTISQGDYSQISAGAYPVSAVGYASAEDVPWHERRAEIVAVSASEAGRIDSCAHWFEGCVNLASADLSGLGGGLSVDACSLFDGCRALASATVPAPFTVSDASRMFRGCASLGAVDNMATLNSAKATDFSEMFFGCSSLREIDLSSLDTRAATSMKRMLHGCTSLQTVTLGDNFTFRGSAWSRLAGGELPVGAWRSSADDKVYASDSLPNFHAATYSKVPDDQLSAGGIPVVSVRGEAQGQDDPVVIETVLTGDEASGYVAESSYTVSDAYDSEELVIGEASKASSTLPAITSGIVNAQSLHSVKADNSKVRTVVAGPQVTTIAPYAFEHTKVTTLQVRSAKLTKQARVAKCLAKSNVQNVYLPSRYLNKSAKANVKSAFVKWSKPKKKCKIY